MELLALVNAVLSLLFFLCCSYQLVYAAVSLFGKRSRPPAARPRPYAAPRPSQRAAIHALRLRHTIAAEYVSVYKERLLYAAQCFREVPYVTVPEPKGTFYLFPNIKKTGLTSKEFADLVLEKAHVKVAPGSDFGAAGEGYFRIACACVSKEKIAEAAERMKHITF